MLEGRVLREALARSVESAAGCFASKLPIRFLFPVVIALARSWWGVRGFCICTSHQQSAVGVADVAASGLAVACLARLSLVSQSGALPAGFG